MSILTNTNLLNSLLEQANNLPDAGVELPELTNEGSASDLLSGKQLIDQEGNVVTGTIPNNGSISKTINLDTTSYTVPSGYTSGGSVSLDSAIPTEIDEQADLIAQIKSAVDGLPEAGSGEGAILETATISVNGYPDTLFRYIGSDGLVSNSALYNGSTIEVVVPSICFIKSGSGGTSGFNSFSVSGACSTMFNNNYVACVEISGIGEIIAVSNIASGG